MACARGDRLALQQLYQREGRYLMGVALRIVRQRQQAEDVLHDAFISIWQRAETFNPARGEGRGWVYSVVRNAALNMVRSGARQVDVSEDVAEAMDDEAALAAYAAAGDPFELHADLGRLENCLSGLAPARRDCCRSRRLRCRRNRRQRSGRASNAASATWRSQRGRPRLCCHRLSRAGGTT